MKSNSHNRIALIAGGTGGPLMPLLAMTEVIRSKNTSAECVCYFPGDAFTEKRLQEAGVRGIRIPAGKLRRYFSLKNVSDVFRIALAFCIAVRSLRRERVGVVVSAGGFAAVPVVWAAWVLRIPRVIHQQDAVVGLANKLSLPFASVKTGALPVHAELIPNVQVIGNPVRSALLQGSATDAEKQFGLLPGKPTLLLIGGGTGAAFFNVFIARHLPELLQIANVIHITGESKFEEAPRIEGYTPKQFMPVDVLANALAAAQLVITRGGFSTLSELACLQKPMIIVPLPNADQLRNAKYFAESAGVAVCLQEHMDKQLVGMITDLLHAPERMQEVSRRLAHVNPSGADARLAAIVNAYVTP